MLGWIHRSNMDSLFTEKKNCVPPVVVEHLRAYSGTDSVGRVVTFRFMGNKGPLPRKATSGSAGYDLYSGEDAVVPASKVRMVDTHVSVTIPLDCYGRVAPRSSLAYRLIDVGGGVIDSDYKGTIWVVIYNFGTDDFVIKAGDRIAQLIIERIFAPLQASSTSTRGIGGFGSNDCHALV